MTIVLPTPLPLVAELDIDDDSHRHMDCTGYAACLEYAAQERWASWSCVLCKARRASRDFMRPRDLDVSGKDWAPATCVVYDPHAKKVVAGRHLVCQAKTDGIDAIQVALVTPAACPVCYTTLWGDVVVMGRRGCSAGHRCVVDGDELIVLGG